MNYQKILVPLDQSSQAQNIFSEAVSLSKTFGSELMLFQSLDWDFNRPLNGFDDLETDLDLSGALSQQYINDVQGALQVAREGLQQYVSQAESANLKTRISVRVGHPGPIICDLAKEWSADLIVMGRRGRSGLAEMLMGSVSNYVLHHAPCAVLVIHP